MAQSRKAAFENIAYELNLDYTPTDEWGLGTYIRDFRLFRRGHSRRITNILCKRDEWLNSQIYIFDFRYTKGAGKSRRVFKQTVFFVESKQLGLPAFWMKPENFLHQIADLLGFKDIDFETHPDFSNQYYLKGDDESYIRHTMNEEVLNFFTIEKKWFLEGVNYYLLLYRRGGYLHPEKIKEFYQKGLKVLTLFKTDPIV